MLLLTATVGQMYSSRKPVKRPKSASRGEAIVDIDADHLDVLARESHRYPSTGVGVPIYVVVKPPTEGHKPTGNGIFLQTSLPRSAL